MKIKQSVFEKSEAFAVRIVNLYKYLRTNKKEFILSNQILRSGTSIFANLSEAKCAISKNDWISKIYIALKECSETSSWLKLLMQTDFLTKSQFDSMYKDCEEIRKMLTSSAKTAKEKITKDARK